MPQPGGYDPNQAMIPYTRTPPSGAAGSMGDATWGPGTTGAPPGGIPPYYGYGTWAGQPERRTRRSPLLYVLAVFSLLVALGAGIGLGSVIFGAHSTAQRSPSIGAPSAPAVSVAPSAQGLQQSIVNVVRAVQPSVVQITSDGGGQEAIGSGDILTPDGYIVTNDHVVDGFSSFRVTLSNGQVLSARVVGQDPQDDLAVLKVSATHLQPIAIADSDKVQVGEFAIAVGNPLGLRQSASFGIVSALNRTESEGPDGPAGELTGLIQTSAPINPGNSGGALVNLQGQLIGIPTLGVSNQQSDTSINGIGFAIPANRVKYVAQQLMQHGHLTTTGQGFLGIQGRDVTPAVASANGLSVQSGVLVTGFANDAAGQSPAQQAGLQIGDVITAVNGTPINDNSDLASAILNRSPGSRVTLTVTRGSSQPSITITLGERPTNTQG